MFAVSTDGVTFRALANIGSPPLPADSDDGYYRAGSTVHILPRHLTIFAVVTKAKKLVLVEENYSGQLGALIREQTGVKIEQRILKFDGRPFSEDELVRELSKVLAGGTAEPVVTHVR